MFNFPTETGFGLNSHLKDRKRGESNLSPVEPVEHWTGVGRVVRWCWVNFQCRGVLLIWIRVGQGSTVLAVDADDGCVGHFSRLSFFFSFSLSLWETVQYRLKYCLKGPLSPKEQTNQRTLEWLSSIQVHIQNRNIVSFCLCMSHTIICDS